MKAYPVVLLAVVMLAGSAVAINVDGVRDGEYGGPLVVQSVETQFGDATGPTFGGSELDAAYAKVSGGRLYLMLTGNLERNFNKLEIFIDSRPGGENVLSSIPDYDFNGGGGWISSNMGGLTFDMIAGGDGVKPFEADYHLFARWGVAGPLDVDFVDRLGGGSAMVPGSKGSGSPEVGMISTGTVLAGSVGPNASGSALSQNLEFAINGNNSLGVIGGFGAADMVAAGAVATGMEFSIALADIGNPGMGESIYISAMINNGDHNFLSNQVLGGLVGPQGNLGGDGGGNFTGNLGGVNFNQFVDPQYFEIVVPEPGSMVLLVVVGGMVVVGRRVRG